MPISSTAPFIYNLEPPALDNARKADVLVIGNSRLEVALSNDATADWFKRAAASYYLLGFSYNENMVFTDDLLRRMEPARRRLHHQCR